MAKSTPESFQCLCASVHDVDTQEQTVPTQWDQTMPRWQPTRRQNDAHSMHTSVTGKANHQSLVHQLQPETACFLLTDKNANRFATNKENIMLKHTNTPLCVTSTSINANILKRHTVNTRSIYTVNHKSDILFLTITLANLNWFVYFYIILITKKFYMRL